MIGYAPDGKYLSVSPEDKDWHIRLTRTDRKSHSEFALHHGKTVTTDDLGEFLGDPHSLPWQPSRKGVGPWREMTADAGQFRIALIAPEDCALPDKQIAREFRELMAGGKGKAT